MSSESLASVKALLPSCPVPGQTPVRVGASVSPPPPHGPGPPRCGPGRRVPGPFSCPALPLVPGLSRRPARAAGPRCPHVAWQLPVSPAPQQPPGLAERRCGRPQPRAPGLRGSEADLGRGPPEAAPGPPRQGTPRPPSRRPLGSPQRRPTQPPAPYGDRPPRPWLPCWPAPQMAASSVCLATFEGDNVCPSQEIHFRRSCWFPVASVTDDHTLSGLKQHSYSSRGQKCP